jgi:hypothetical protein
VRTACCPLCDTPVEGDLDLRDHLDTTHDLRDDPGRTTSIEDLVTVLVDPPAPSPVAEEPVEELHLRIHDPAEGDDRWQPIAIGLGGIVLLVLAFMALQLVA